MSLEIRRFNINDKMKVNKILLDNFSYEKKKDEVPSNIFEYVLEANGEVVGYFIITNVSDIVKDINYYLVDYVCIDINCQGHGYGQYMIKYIKELAKENHISFVQLTCSSKRGCARHIYEKYGFKLAETNLFRLVIE